MWILETREVVMQVEYRATRLRDVISYTQVRETSPVGGRVRSECHVISRELPIT